MKDNKDLLRQVICVNCGARMYVPLTWKITTKDWHCNPSTREQAIRPGGERR